MLEVVFCISWAAAAWGETPAVKPSENVSVRNIGNRLSYLESFCDPYYPHVGTARLATPQWIGDAEVVAAIVLAIDDFRDSMPEEKRPEVYENYLRPILERLKKIDGRAPVSLMTTRIQHPDLPVYAQWLREGITLETHTADHPCPLLQKNDFPKAKATYETSVDLVGRVPGNRPVAFRMPCCDSMNSVSPRFFAEIFNRQTPEGRFVQADSSVFLLFSSEDPVLPRDRVLDEAGRQRFQKYIAEDRLMANYVQNYPYPWVIDRLCWEVPAVMPSDWEAHHAHGSQNPKTVEDWKAAVDLVVVKQGAWALCFHPYTWIANQQVLEVVEYAATKYPRKVRFLNFREMLDRMTQNALGGVPLRSQDGQDNGVRLLDLDADGWMDVVIGNEQVRQTRLWSPQKRQWIVGDLPVPIVVRNAEGKRLPTGVRFGVLQASGKASLLLRNETQAGLWHFDGQRWVECPDGLAGLQLNEPVMTCRAGQDQGTRLRDIDADGICELIVGSPSRQAVFRYQSGGTPRWQRLSWSLPTGTWIVDEQGRDAGLRLVDLNEDGCLDVVFSNSRRYSIHLFTSPEAGWTRKIVQQQRPAQPEASGQVPSAPLAEKVGLAKGMEKASGEKSVSESAPLATAAKPRILPPFVRADGTNAGAWFAYGSLWIQNEETGGVLPNHVDRWTFGELLQLGKAFPSSVPGSTSAPLPSPALPCEECR